MKDKLILIIFILIPTTLFAQGDLDIQVDVKCHEDTSIACDPSKQRTIINRAQSDLNEEAKSRGEHAKQKIHRLCSNIVDEMRELCGPNSKIGLSDSSEGSYGADIRAVEAEIIKKRSENEQIVESADTNEVLLLQNFIKDLQGLQSKLEEIRADQAERIEECKTHHKLIIKVCVPPKLVPTSTAKTEDDPSYLGKLTEYSKQGFRFLEETFTNVVYIEDRVIEEGEFSANASLGRVHHLNAPAIHAVRENARSLNDSADVISTTRETTIISQQQEITDYIESARYRIEQLQNCNSGTTATSTVGAFGSTSAAGVTNGCTPPDPEPAPFVCTGPSCRPKPRPEPNPVPIPTPSPRPGSDPNNRGGHTAEEAQRNADQLAHGGAPGGTSSGAPGFMPGTLNALRNVFGKTSATDIPFSSNNYSTNRKTNSTKNPSVSTFDGDYKSTRPNHIDREKMRMVASGGRIYTGDDGPTQKQPAYNSLAGTTNAIKNISTTNINENRSTSIPKKESLKRSDKTMFGKRMNSQGSSLFGTNDNATKGHLNPPANISQSGIEENDRTDSRLFDPSKYVPSSQAQAKAYERATGRKLAANTVTEDSVEWPKDISRNRNANIFNTIKIKYSAQLK